MRIGRAQPRPRRHGWDDESECPLDEFQVSPRIAVEETKVMHPAKTPRQHVLLQQPDKHLAAGQSVGTAVERLIDPPHGAEIGLDGIMAFALTLQYANMALVQ